MSERDRRAILKPRRGCLQGKAPHPTNTVRPSHTDASCLSFKAPGPPGRRPASARSRGRRACREITGPFAYPTGLLDAPATRRRRSAATPASASPASCFRKHDAGLADAGVAAERRRQSGRRVKQARRVGERAGRFSRHARRPRERAEAGRLPGGPGALKERQDASVWLGRTVLVGCGALP